MKLEQMIWKMWTLPKRLSKPAAQPSMTLPMHGSQQSLVGLQSYQNMMPGMQPQMMSPYGIQPLAAAGDSSGMMQINVDFQTLRNFVRWVQHNNINLIVGGRMKKTCAVNLLMYAVCVKYT